MLREVLVGAAVGLCNIAIHAFLMAAVMWAARTAVAITTPRQSHQLIAVMIATVSFLMAAHFAGYSFGHWLTRLSALHLKALISFTSLL